MINLFIDNNAWDEFFYAKIDLIKELSPKEFSLYITREAELEIALMPTEKKRYVESTINTGLIHTDVYFGFYNENLPENEQRVSGFGDLSVSTGVENFPLMGVEKFPVKV